MYRAALQDHIIQVSTTNTTTTTTLRITFRGIQYILSHCTLRRGGAREVIPSPCSLNCECDFIYLLLRVSLCVENPCRCYTPDTPECMWWWSGVEEKEKDIWWLQQKCSCFQQMIITIRLCCKDIRVNCIGGGKATCSGVIMLWCQRITDSHER